MACDFGRQTPDVVAVLVDWTGDEGAMLTFEVGFLKEMAVAGPWAELANL